MTPEQARKLANKYQELEDTKHKGKALAQYAIDIEIYPERTVITQHVITNVIKKARGAWRNTGKEDIHFAGNFNKRKAPEIQIMLFNFLNSLPRSLSQPTDFWIKCFDTILPKIEAVEPDYCELMDLDTPTRTWFEVIKTALGGRFDKEDVNEELALSEVVKSGVWGSLDGYNGSRIGNAAQTSIELSDRSAATLMVCKLANGKNVTPLVVSKEEMPHYIQMYQNHYNGDSDEPSFEKTAMEQHEIRKEFVHKLVEKRHETNDQRLTKIIERAEGNYRYAVEATTQRLEEEWKSRDHVILHEDRQLKIPLIKKETESTKRLYTLLGTSADITNQMWYNAAHEGENDESYDLTGPDMLLPMRHVKQWKGVVDVVVTLKWFVCLVRDLEVSSENRFLLFLDDLPQYKQAWEIASSWDTMRGFDVVFLPSCATSYLQPLNMGVVKGIHDDAKELEKLAEVSSDSIILPLHRLNYYALACKDQDEVLVAQKFGKSPVMLFHKDTERTRRMIDSRRRNGVHEVIEQYKSPNEFYGEEAEVMLISDSNDEDNTITSIAPTLETSEDALLWLQSLGLRDLLKGGSKHQRELCAKKRSALSDEGLQKKRKRAADISWVSRGSKGVRKPKRVATSRTKRPQGNFTYVSESEDDTVVEEEEVEKVVEKVVEKGVEKAEEDVLPPGFEVDSYFEDSPFTVLKCPFRVKLEDHVSFWSDEKSGHGRFRAKKYNCW